MQTESTIKPVSDITVSEISDSESIVEFFDNIDKTIRIDDDVETTIYVYDYTYIKVKSNSKILQDITNNKNIELYHKYAQDIDEYSDIKILDRLEKRIISIQSEINKYKESNFRNVQKERQLESAIQEHKLVAELIASKVK